MLRRLAVPPLAALLALLAGAPALRGQPGAPAAGPPPPDTAAPGAPVRALRVVGGAAEEAARTAQLRGQQGTEGTMLRSPSSAGERDGVWVIAPEVLLSWNSRIPFSLNDGALWAGKGGGALLMAGVGVQAGPLRLIVAPELVSEQNAAFDSLLPVEWDAAQRASFVAPWQRGRDAIDLPFRMGDGARTRLRPGQSSLTLTAGPVAVGAATENQWWGPGLRNALVLSNQAPGFDHLFVRSARPLRTPAGSVEFRWISGALHDSEWAGAVTGDEPGWRSLSAASVVLAPTRTLSLGMARSVQGPADGGGDALSHAADVLLRWRGESDPETREPFEQITTLFGRLVLPKDGAEVYAEWGRMLLPVNTADLMQAPEHSQGYTLGLQWLPVQLGGRLRLQAEHTYLEQSPTFATRYVGSWYASAAVPQGYTHEGQVLGASVGPGASGQWLAADWLRGRGRAGLFLGRIRWSEDAYYTQPGGPNLYLGHDVSVFGGVRGVFVAGPVRVDAEYALERRFNFLFQNDAINFLDHDNDVDVTNHTLRLRLSTAAPLLGPHR
jgi:hypothetical protein